MSRTTVTNGWVFWSLFVVTAMAVLALIGCSSSINGAGSSSSLPHEVAPLPGDVTAYDHLPVLLHKEEAAYPRLAQQAGLEGTVRLKLRVETSGKVSDAQVYVSSGTPSLDEGAMAAGRRCVFIPATYKRQVIPLWVVVEYDFRLDDQIAFGE